ncbi:MAG: MBOAT family protein, partial [Spirochaetia bacterium]|nr:MBOAT family protein [Spirochaetia bacterium]
MLFNSVSYFIFAPIVVFLYFQLRDRERKWWLLLASIYFYAAFRVPFLLILFASITLTYIAAIKIESSEGGFFKKIYLATAVMGNLSLLYFFKYIDFSFRVFNQTFSLSPCEPFYLNSPGVILPLGISFFTLQAVSYAVDVYRGIVPASRNYFHFTLYLTFFPQLVAGPIMRAKDLLYQFSEKKHFSFENLYPGLRLIAGGFVKKTFIGDQAGLVVDEIFAHPDQYSWISIWLGVFFFAFQIYG